MLANGLLRRLNEERWPKGAITDEAGQLQISSLPDTGTVVAAGGLGFAAVPLAEVQASGTVILQSYGRVTGVCKVGGKPVAGRELWLTLPRLGLCTDFYSYTAITDAEGLFTIDKVPPGRGTLARTVKISPYTSNHSHMTEDGLTELRSEVQLP